MYSRATDQVYNGLKLWLTILFSMFAYLIQHFWFRFRLTYFYYRKQLYQTTYSFAYISPKGVSVHTNKSKKQISKCLSVATVNKSFLLEKIEIALKHKHFKVCYCNQTFNEIWNVLTVVIYRCDDSKSRNSAKLYRSCSLQRFPETWMFRLRRKHQSDLPQDQHARGERRQRLLWSFYSSKF